MSKPSTDSLFDVQSDYVDYPIDQCQIVHDVLYATNGTQKTHPVEYRLHYMKKLGYMVQDHAEEICEAVNKDLGRKKEETEFGEVSCWGLTWRLRLGLSSYQTIHLNSTFADRTMNDTGTGICICTCTCTSLSSGRIRFGRSSTKSSSPSPESENG